MKVRSILKGAALAAVVLSGSARADKADLLSDFTCMIEGHWDNIAQEREDAAAGRTGMGYHPRRAMSYIPIKAPELDGQLFAIMNYGDAGFDGPLTRVSLHRFRLGETSDSIIHEFIFPHKDNPARKPHENPEAIPALTNDNVRVNTTCSMHWRRKDNHFVGATIKGKCKTNSFTAEMIAVEGNGELHKGLLVRHDMNFTLSGERLPTPGGDSAELFKRTTREGFETDALAARLLAIKKENPACHQ